MEFDFTDIAYNQLKEFTYNQEKILVYRKNGRFYATSSKCTHYGAPLINGVHNGDTVRCPWHGACFNLKTGDIEDFPGLDNLTCYKVEKVRDNIYSISKPDNLINNFVPKTKNHFYILGGGPSGLECAETLRKQNFDGKITILTKDCNLPYDRPKLSKTMDLDIAKIVLRNEEFYVKRGIDIRTNMAVRSVDFDTKTIFTISDQQYKYDKLYIALGSSPIIPNVPGIKLGNIFSLRSLADAQNMYRHIKEDKDVVIIGSSFIGMEIASIIKGKAKSITVVTNTSVPFERAFGIKIGTFLKSLHESNGIKFQTNTSLQAFEGDNSNLVRHVILADGSKIPCDICILGLGVRPVSAQLFNGTKLVLNQFGCIEVNEFMETSVPNVYAGGDTVSFPLYLTANDFESFKSTPSGKWNKANIQHWQMAHKHGQIGAYNMLDKKIPIKSVPYFWTAQYGKGFRYVGYTMDSDQTIIHSNEDQTKMVAYYMKGNIVRAVLTLNRDPVASIFAELMFDNKHWFITSEYLATIEDVFEQNAYVQALKELIENPIINDFRNDKINPGRMHLCDNDPTMKVHRDNTTHL